MGEEDIARIVRTFGDFAASKIFASHEFGYRRMTIERTLRLSVQFTDERLAELRFASGRLNAVMRRRRRFYLLPAIFPTEI